MRATLSFLAVALASIASASPGDTSEEISKPYGSAWGPALNSSSSSLPATSSSTSGWASSSLPHSAIKAMTTSAIGSSSTIPSHGATTASANTTTTETLTTYTTVTTCPITFTTSAHDSTYMATTLTTSTMTITSCKGGCHPSHIVETTSTPAPITTPVTHTSIYTVTIQKTVTTFVPCSTPVGSSSATTYYSTWLTASSYTTDLKTLTTDCWTEYPTTTTAATPWIPGSSAKAIATESSTTKPMPTTPAALSTAHESISVPTAVTNSIWRATESACAPAATIYSTIISYSTIHAPNLPTATPTAAPKCHACKTITESVTVTLSNCYTTCLTITHIETAIPTTSSTTASSTYVPGQNHSWSVSSHGQSGHVGTGTGSVKLSGWVKSTGWMKPTGASATEHPSSSGSAKPTSAEYWKAEW